MMGPLQTGKVILGEDVGTDTPQGLSAAVYYPRNERDHRVPGPNPLHVSSGPFPILLYAHAARDVDTPSSHSPSRDFTSVEVMLRFVAAYGCVCIAPDLSQLSHNGGPTGFFEERGVVLASYFAYMASINATLFANQLDFSRVLLVGHSKGAGGATHAGRIISGFGEPKKVMAYGLIAPENGGDTGPDVHPLLVLGGTLDLDQTANPEQGYRFGGNPKTWVTIPGANHFGYTDICPTDNSCNSVGLLDENGTITREGQQQTAASYLAALLRYFVLNDNSARPYLSGERIVEGLEKYVTGIQVQSSGFEPPDVVFGGPAKLLE